ncbi:transmembrane protein 272-like isoform X1 [Triplophysa rosa]|uniref:transmembrane protein 272-like isoform X1 n=2 Tax=Triplophysa rosa TaxID=992332 RepID=UPI002545D8C3|nr:transmembrane protein 272-like isoform X1 [Triplophysa rosa]
MIENKGQSERKKMEDRNLLQNIRTPPKLSTPVLIISKLLVVVLPIAQVSIGGVYLNDCPKQPYIPIYLLVSGVFALVLGLLSCLPCTQEPEDGTQTPLSGLCTAWNSLVSLFLFCWFIAGKIATAM